jgi:hypothetical protein
MNNQQYKANKVILANAPEGADSDVVDITGAYFDEHCNHLNSEVFWSELDITPVSPRSLADIARIVELEKEKQAIVEQHDMWKNQWHELNCSLLSRDLEQQLQILKKYANTCGVLRKEPSTRDLHELIMELESQAKALKEGE